MMVFLWWWCYGMMWFGSFWWCQFSINSTALKLTQFTPHFRFDEKGNLEVLLFTIQSKMRANNQRVYLPREGRLISDINKAWEKLEKAEHERELALREELIRSANKNSLSFLLVDMKRTHSLSCWLAWSELTVFLASRHEVEEKKNVEVAFYRCVMIVVFPVQTCASLSGTFFF